MDNKTIAVVGVSVAGLAAAGAGGVGAYRYHQRKKSYDADRGLEFFDRAPLIESLLKAHRAYLNDSFDVAFDHIIWVVDEAQAAEIADSFVSREDMMRLVLDLSGLLPKVAMMTDPAVASDEVMTPLHYLKLVAPLNNVVFSEKVKDDHVIAKRLVLLIASLQSLVATAPDADKMSTVGDGWNDQIIEIRSYLSHLSNTKTNRAMLDKATAQLGELLIKSKVMPHDADQSFNEPEPVDWTAVNRIIGDLNTKIHQDINK